MDASTTDASRDASIGTPPEAGVPDGGVDAGAFDWKNPCAAPSNFPAGTYELRYFRYYSDLESESGVGSMDATRDTFSLSRLRTEKLTIVPDPLASDCFDVIGDGFDILGWEPPTCVTLVPIDDDSVRIEWSFGTFTNGSISLVVHARSGFITDFVNTAAEQFMAPSAETHTGNGFRVCDAVHDGGAAPPPLPAPIPPAQTNVDDFSAVPPPGCTIFGWQEGTNSPKPSCESSIGFGGDAGKHNGCSLGQALACVDNGGGCNVLCCPE